MCSCDAVNWSAVVLTGIAQFVTAGEPYECVIARAMTTQEMTRQYLQPNGPMRYREESFGSA